MEALELANALELRLHSMMEELVHTDDRSYKAYLRQRYERLEEVQTLLVSRISFASMPPEPDEELIASLRS
jgi:hypothetical protein